MSLPKTKENRRHTREKRKCFLPGVLVTSSGREIRAWLLDISDGGMGIRTADEILPEYRLVLDLNGLKLPFEVVWGRQDNNREDCYRYGLRLCESLQLVDLMNMYLDTSDSSTEV